MADAIQKAARSRYGQETNIRADTNPNTGEIAAAADGAVEKVDDYATRSSRLASAIRTPSFGTSRRTAAADGFAASPPSRPAGQQKVREAERDRQYDEYKDRIGEIVNGTVKRVEYGNVIVDLGRRGHHPSRRADPARN
jgi:N utilization substance protein A